MREPLLDQQQEQPSSQDDSTPSSLFTYLIVRCPLFGRMECQVYLLSITIEFSFVIFVLGFNELEVISFFVFQCFHIKGYS
jgi:hypothetical protein